MENLLLASSLVKLKMSGCHTASESYWVTVAGVAGVAVAVCASNNTCTIKIKKNQTKRSKKKKILENKSDDDDDDDDNGNS